MFRHDGSLHGNAFHTEHLIATEQERLLATTIISKKRDGETLTPEEIQFMIDGMLDGTVPDYQMSALAMAIVCRGMVPTEIIALTECMLQSGKTLPRVSDRPRVDKHSTGGLGDKVSLILAPLLACFDLEVPMLSGRGLGITGGTLDKLESYAGYRCDLSEDEIGRGLAEVGCIITGTTPQITPADNQLYALRDVTGTVPSIALITASILSKKLAESLDALVLDVKFGSGAFMQTLDDAKALACSLQNTSQQMGLATSVVLSDMNQPLGRMVGNACEANESVDVLKAAGPADVTELTLRLAAELLTSTSVAQDASSAKHMLEQAIHSGAALEKYIRLIEYHGGKYTDQLPLAPCYQVVADQSGYVGSVNGQSLGQSVIALGGGRRKKGDQLDYCVGLEILCRVGDSVSSGQPLMNVFANSPKELAELENQLRTAIRVVPSPVSELPLIVSLD